MPARPTRRRHATHRAALLTALLAVGCSAGSGTATSGGTGSTGGPGGEPPVRARVVLDAAKLELPLARYSLSWDEGQLLNRAEVRLVAECAARFGVTYSRSSDPDADEAMPKTLTDRRYGVANAEQAATAGFDLTPTKGIDTTKATERSDTGPTTETVLSGDGRAHVGGREVPEDGCNGEARQRMARTAPPSEYQNLPLALIDQGFTLSRQDSRVRAALASWSGCMRGRGFDYRDPLDAVADPRFTDGTSPLEIRTATADVACKRETNLVGIWFAVESAYEKRLVTDNLDRLEEVRRANTARVAAARATG
ncbi:hypothetical protein ACI2L1_17755 [Streptomyces sp. NPDC019531]|uniref:hypothetical protein n=1 Tax=Streptomyces sp. NPDC019531 TaxID=3365062 RepID=UPI00385119F9